MKTIFSYIMIFALITLYALFLDAVSGLFVLIILFSAIVISTALHIYAITRFYCEISVNSDLVEKTEDVILTARFARTLLPQILLPTVFIVELDLSYHLCAEAENESCTVLLSRRNSERIFRLKPQFWGKANVSIKSVKAVDILGFCAVIPGLGRLSKDNYIFERNVLKIKVFPSIPDLSKTSELIRALQDASAYDDNEQSREIPFAITGFPGYEHRDYVPGDSLKSVNWKLSAKRDRLLTRKPEAYAGGDMVMVLDSNSSDYNNQIKGDLTTRTREQTALESMLSASSILTELEILCRVYVRFENGWEMTQLQSSGDIEKLRFALTDYEFNSSYADRIPDLSAEKASGFVVFSAAPDDALYSITDQLRQRGITPEIASSAPGYSNNWSITQTDGEIIFTRS